MIWKALIIKKIYLFKFSLNNGKNNSIKAVKQQTLSCSIVICETNDADCAFKPDGFCPATESDSQYEFEEFKIIDLGR